MKLFNSRVTKWVMRFYPPLLFQRIWVKKISTDFREIEVCIYKSLFNLNYNRSIFGGTIFSAADPFYPIIFANYFTKRNVRIECWVKSASITYLRPGNTNLTSKFIVTNEELLNIEYELNRKGVFCDEFEVKIYNSSNKICAVAKINIWIKKI